MSLARNLTRMAHGVNTSGVLATPYGGTSATTLTGIVKGNGAGAFTAAVDGTDYVSASKLNSGTLPGSFTTLSASGNTTLGDSAADTVTINAGRILGDFSNATLTDRVGFKTSVLNGNTALCLFPNGTSKFTQFVNWSGDGANETYLSISSDLIGAQISAGKTGSANAVSLSFLTNGINAFTISAVSQAVTSLKVTELNSGPLGGFRNRIINGGFDVWQRGASFSLANDFTADRFKVQSNAAQSVTRVDYGAAGSGLYAARVTVSNTAAYINFGTIVENGYNDIVGKVVTFSVKMRASSAVTLTMYLGKMAAFDTATQISATPKSVTTSWATYSVTFDATALSYDATNKHLRVTVGPEIINLGVAGWVEFKDVQLEPGSAPTPFEFRHNELALCQRYYRVNKGAAGSWDEVTNTTFYVGADSYFDMRATPTPTLLNGTALITRPGVGNYNASTIAITDYVMSFTTNAAFVGVPGYLRAGYVALSAEL